MTRFRTLFFLLLLVELISFTAYFFPWLKTVGFFLIVVAALVFSLRQLEYGLYFVLADLILGGKSGALFSFEYSDFFLSLRMALFIVVMGVWVGKAVSERLHNASKPPLKLRGGVLWWWGVVGLAVGWGMVVGLVRGNNFGDLFLDANGYFYVAMVVPFWWAAMRMDTDKTEWMRMLMTFFFAATTLLALKTLFAVYWFTHAGNNFIAANLVPFYRWVRDTGVGEITWLDGNFARVFFQSQIYNVMAWFVILGGLITPPTSHYLKGRKLIWWGLLALNAAVILVSLSRSFWVGMVVGLIVFAVIAVRNHSQPPLNLRGGVIGLFGSVIGALIILLIVARFPLPPPAPVDLSLAAQSRLAFEPAAASRWNLLPPMWAAVREHPIVGSGFGRTITYTSNDPRVREVSSTGQYTTYAFEWGWLDAWLKLGAVGLLPLIGLVGTLAYTFWIAASKSAWHRAGIGILVSLVSLNVFTPYLNHPLGLGILILLTLFTFYGRLNKVVF